MASHIVGLLAVAVALSVLLAMARKLEKFKWAGFNMATESSTTQAILGTRIDSFPDFDWKAVQPYKFRPFKPIYHISMAIQNSTPSELITIDTDYHDRVELRKSLLCDKGSAVHGLIPEGQSAVQELYSFLLGSYLPSRYPTIFCLSQDGKIFTNNITNTTFPSTAPEDLSLALRIIGETVDEDIFLLSETPDFHLSVAFVCCFPSGFDPSEKLGKSLKDVHGPVPHYEKIGPSMERYFRKLEVGKAIRRLNWAIQTSPDLYKPSGNHIHEDHDVYEKDENVDISQTHLRVELQTLLRLPKTRAILFAFKTYRYHIREIKEEGLGPQLVEAIEGLKKGNAPGFWTYKGGVRWGKRVCEYLRE